jgi:hypothetical protein
LPNLPSPTAENEECSMGELMEEDWTVLPEDDWP